MTKNSATVCCSITIFEPAHTRKGKLLKDTIRSDMRWVGECQYHKDQGIVELAWWHRMKSGATKQKRPVTLKSLAAPGRLLGRLRA